MNVTPLVISVLKDTFVVCRFDTFSQIPESILQSHFYSITKTADELSIVCPQDYFPPAGKCEMSWRCFKIHGPLDFAQTGILASLTTPLADADISVFAFSTYDTDYVMVKEHELDRAVQTLKNSGHDIHLNN